MRVNHLNIEEIQAALSRIAKNHIYCDIIVEEGSNTIAIIGNIIKEKLEGLSLDEIEKLLE